MAIKTDRQRSLQLHIDHKRSFDTDVFFMVILISVKLSPAGILKELGHKGLDITFFQIKNEEGLGGQKLV